MTIAKDLLMSLHILEKLNVTRCRFFFEDFAIDSGHKYLLDCAIKKSKAGCIHLVLRVLGDRACYLKMLCALRPQENLRH